MSPTGSLLLVFLVFCGILLAAAREAHATASGLNNIPTADVTPVNVLVLQQINNLGPDQQTLSHIGFKYGLMQNTEIGLDRRFSTSGSGTGVAGAGGMPAGPWVLQAKYRLALPGTNTSFGLGVANVGEDSTDSGDSFPYAVLTQDFKSVRGHIGYGGQGAGKGLFVGADKTLAGGTVLRADWIQTDSRDESVASVGFLKPLRGPWIIEAWASFPTASGVEDTFTIKFDYVISR